MNIHTLNWTLPFSFICLSDRLYVSAIIYAHADGPANAPSGSVKAIAKHLCIYILLHLNGSYRQELLLWVRFGLLSEEANVDAHFCFWQAIA